MKNMFLVFTIFLLYVYQLLIRTIGGTLADREWSDTEAHVLVQSAFVHD